MTRTVKITYKTRKDVIYPSVNNKMIGRIEHSFPDDGSWVAYTPCRLHRGTLDECKEFIARVYQESLEMMSEVMGVECPHVAWK